MTNGIAIVLAVLIAALLAVDALVLDSVGAVAVGRAFLGLVEWLAFWR